jgi:transcription-repair coupling factor (superfamily II helicase)
VQDIEAEWLDRYGPLPKAAEALLAVAHLRAESARLGLREVTIIPGSGFTSPGSARLSPVTLKTSQQIRLKRLHPKAVYKEADQLLILPIPPKANPAELLVAQLAELLPPDAGS